jgi:signal transduction histidine kinase
MTGTVALDLAMTAVSLFNAILLLWLALTVLLNAERRTAGLWTAAGALLLGSLFFLIHTVIVGYGYVAPTFGLQLMWDLAWLPITCLPFTWYSVILWYSGYWDVTASQGDIRQRHRPWFLAAVAGVSVIILMQVVAQPIPSLSQILAGDFHARLEIAGIPALLVVFPVYAAGCVVLTIDALRHPAPALRMMGELARQRAHPWLLATSIALLLVSFLVAGATAIVLTFYARLPFSGDLPPELGLLDLVAAGIIALAVLLVGQATVSYEIFTGKALPRRSLRRNWYWAIGVSAVQSLVLSSILQIHFPQVYTIMLAALVTIIFFALQNRSDFRARDDSINTLRPFVSSQRFVEHILSGTALDRSQPTQEQVAFTTLCRDVLNTRQALLLPAGRLALLAGDALAYPDSSRPLSPQSLAALPTNAEPLAQALDAPLDGWASWAVSLGDRNNRSGWLLLGERSDGDLYTHEQIEFARDAGERLIDQRAGAEMARRLVALQRQRITEGQVLDQRTRRILHDEVLPTLHSALLSLNVQRNPDAIAALTESHRQISALLRELPGSDAPARAITRLGLVGALRECAANELEPSALAEFSIATSAQVEQALAGLPPLAVEVVYFAAREGLRNAARHSRRADGSLPLVRMSFEWRQGLWLTICDNGAGQAVQPGLPAVPGAQQGLAVHSAALAVLGGGLELTSKPGETCLAIWLPEQAFYDNTL